jgi:hypothetical protein
MQEWSHWIDLHMTCMPHIYEPGAWSFMLWLCGFSELSVSAGESRTLALPSALTR